MNRPTRFGLVWMNPSDATLQVHLRPFEVERIRLPKTRCKREQHNIALMLRQL